MHAFKHYAAKESQLLLEKLDRWLVRKDTEHQSLGTPGSRLGLGIYVIETEHKQVSENTTSEHQGNVTDE